MAPIEIKSHLDEPKVRLAQKKLAATMTEKQRARFFPKLDTYNDMIRAADEYVKKKSPALPLGSFVYRDYIPGVFDKASFSEKRGEIFIISEVIFNRSVYRYKLKSLSLEQQVGSYYRENLKLVPKSGQPTTVGAWE
jgi:hypothetical protein